MTVIDQQELLPPAVETSLEKELFRSRAHMPVKAEVKKQGHSRKLCFVQWTLPPYENTFREVIWQ